MNLKKLFVLLLVSSCLLFPFTAYAAGGEGGALTLSSSTPANNEHNVKLPVEINLTFSNNVVNMNVKDENLKCFSLASSDGTNIPIEVKMADDQVQPDKKREVILIPKQDLKLNTAYTITISSALKSKNGDSLGKDVKVTFDTGKPAGGNTAADTAKPASSNSAATDTAKPAGSNTGTIVMIVVVVAVAALVIGFVLKRKSMK